MEIMTLLNSGPHPGVDQVLEIGRDRHRNAGYQESPTPENRGERMRNASHLTDPADNWRHVERNVQPFQKACLVQGCANMLNGGFPV
jgi:hypothetical protein